MDAPTRHQKEQQRQLHGSGGRRPRAPPPLVQPSAPRPTSKGAETDAVTQKRRKPKSLLLLLKSFVGLRVRIDLKNDSVIEGVVEEVVRDMEYVDAQLRV